MCRESLTRSESPGVSHNVGEDVDLRLSGGFRGFYQTRH